ncbi:MAG: DNA mismatch repair protein MutS [Tepidisphaeraceae bacterium]
MADTIPPSRAPAPESRTAAPAVDDAKLSPAMRQYMAFKRQYPEYILFLRMGDFYELFWEDAKTAARTLNITLTSRDKNSESPIPMAGVPFHSVESYLRRMIRAGHRVAIAEQMEDPKTAKGVVKRDVTRLITPGTLTDESFLDGRSDNYLAAISFSLTKRHGQRCGIAWAELSTGGIWAMSGDEAAVLDQLGRIQAAEVLVPETSAGTVHPIAAQVKLLNIKAVSARPGWQHTQHHATEAIRKQWQVRSAAGFGFEDDDDPGVISVGALLSYLEETQRASLAHLKAPRLHVQGEHLALDPASYRSLEIERTTRGNTYEGSLLHAIDRTRTSMGARLLRQWVRFPLCEIEHIRARQHAVAALVESGLQRQRIVDALDNVCDVERIVARLTVGRASPRDLAALGKCMAALPALLDELATMASMQRVAPELVQLREFCLQQSKYILSAIKEEPAPHLREGGVIADGFDVELDRLRTLAENSQQWLANYQATLANNTGIGSLKVAYNKVFGYYIEVTDANRAKVPMEWSRRQTVKNAERYVTPELKKFEDEVLTARDRSIALENQLFETIRQALLPSVGTFQELAAGLARLDVVAALATLAVQQRYVRPEVVTDRVLHVTDGRHPVLEQQLGPGGALATGTQFVANDIHFDEAHTLNLITGPNMAGKSTYIRQIALITLLAHIGSFVPASQAKVGLVDRIFTRIGASDEIHAGQSTFMVEMTETANILNNATERSLVILDEIGRGTSTLDGLSLAWAIAEHLSLTVRARSLFATHYHELTQLAEQEGAGVRNFNVAVREWEDQVIFLHRIVEGGTDRSYGIHVARLAGVPKSVLARAKDLLSQLAVQHVGDGRPVVAPPTRQPVANQQLMLFGYEPSGLTKALDAVDPDDFSPREALELLRKWKEKFGA